VHGLLVWGLAVALGALLAAAAASTVAGTSAPAASVPGSTAGEPLIAYELDRLFRTQQVPPWVYRSRRTFDGAAGDAAGDPLRPRAARFRSRIR
jgi:hypothetical protein